MKDLLASLLCALCLLMAGDCQAAVQEFGPSFSRFAIDVPEGWTAKALKNGVQMVSRDRQNSIAAIIDDNRGLSAEQIAKGVAQKTGLKEVRRKNESNYFVTGVKDGTKVAITITVAGKIFVMFTMAGSDADALCRIIDSFRLAK
ncbi:MAG: hypothetical protein IKX75_03480 [Desulfovibrio sp.]|nr:hypothetical protein [Desulfovibrio sp.]